jgi:hypothetical protein
MDEEINRRVFVGREVVGTMAKLTRSVSVFVTQGKTCCSQCCLITYLTAWFGILGVSLENHRSKLNAVGMSFLWAMCGENRFDRVRNDWVINECNVTENVFNKYETSVLRWFGHVKSDNALSVHLVISTFICFPIYPSLHHIYILVWISSLIYISNIACTTVSLNY